MQKQIPYFPNSKEFSNYVDAKEYNYSAKQSYYRFLGILPTAGEKEIHKAILRAYKLFHPDTGGHFPNEYEHLLEIKDVLTNKELKKLYDRTGFNKELLTKVFAKITTDTIICANQGVTQFEKIKIILTESYSRERENKKKDKFALITKIAKIEKVIEDIKPSAMSKYLIDNLTHEIRAYSAQINLVTEEIDNLESLIWLVKNLTGNTMIELEEFINTDFSSRHDTSGYKYDKYGNEIKTW